MDSHELHHNRDRELTTEISLAVGILWSSASSFPSTWQPLICPPFLTMVSSFRGRHAETQRTYGACYQRGTGKADRMKRTKGVEYRVMRED